MQKHELKTAKHFCMMPWVHMHLLPSSAVLPCCVWPYDQPLGDAATAPLTEIWNNKAYRDLRLGMLQDNPIAGCSQCYERDAAGGGSLRKETNKNFQHLFERLVAPTLSDGELKEFRMSYFDVRFSNICTFKCRGCSPELSSAWLGDHEKLYDYKSDRSKLISVMPNERLWNELIELLPTVEMAYFAGGEPLIMDEHYLVLEELIRLGADIPLSYNTNMSNLRFRDKLVTDYWNRFKRVMVGVSIDDFGERGEYFRSGMSWQKTLENIRLVQEKCPHVIFSVNCTVSLFNVNYIPELHTELVRQKVIGLGDFFCNLLVTPEQYRVQMLPRDYREKVAKKLRDYIARLYAVYQARDPIGVARVVRAIDSVVRFMLEGRDDAADVALFHSHNEKLDMIRGESFEKVHPELSQVLKAKSAE
jgi:MoaA/NifB/PqqE/SkfB family radical SAM enzyme